MRNPIESLRESRLFDAETSSEGDRATTLELFFDVVFVFAFTQVSALMAAKGDGDGISVLRGLVLLTMIWWCWSCYAWLANQAHADRGIVLVAMAAAIPLMFILSLVVPEAFDDLPGGLYAPIVFVVCYVAVRVVHVGAYAIAAGSDVELRRQAFVSMGTALVPATMLLVIGAFAGAPWQAPLWVAAVVVDLLAVYLTSRRRSNWRINSVEHFAERHGLVVILALGESIVAIGIGVAQEPVSYPIIGGSLLAVALTMLCWWIYFHHFAGKARRQVARSEGVELAGIARDAYTYLHLVIVAGIVVAALGIEEAMHHVEDSTALGTFGAAALDGGLALYLVGTALTWYYLSRQWALIRVVGAVVLVAAIPLGATIAALAAFAVATAVLALVAAAEQYLIQTGSLWKLEWRQPA